MDSVPHYRTIVRLAGRHQSAVPYMASSWQYNNKHTIMLYACIQLHSNPQSSHGWSLFLLAVCHGEQLLKRTALIARTEKGVETLNFQQLALMCLYQNCESRRPLQGHRPQSAQIPSLPNAIKHQDLLERLPDTYYSATACSISTMDRV